MKDHTSIGADVTGDRDRVDRTRCGAPAGRVAAFLVSVITGGAVVVASLTANGSIDAGFPAVRPDGRRPAGSAERRLATTIRPARARSTHGECESLMSDTPPYREVPSLAISPGRPAGESFRQVHRRRGQ